MFVLGIDTSTHRGSVALFGEGRLLGYAFHEEANRHGELLSHLVDEVLTQAGVERRRLSRVAVGVGPGSFTGLRVGIAHGIGIATGLGVQSVGVGSLRAMAYGALTPQLDRVWAATDARRGELFLACYTGAERALVAPFAAPVAECKARIAELDRALQRSGKAAVVGSAAELMGLQEADGFPLLRRHQCDLPDARTIAELGAGELGLCSPQPEYVREPDAIVPNLPPCPLDLPPECDPQAPLRKLTPRLPGSE